VTVHALAVFAWLGTVTPSIIVSEMYEAAFHFLGLFCHQLPERSFFVFGAQFPLCIRCSALLAGALGALVYVFIRLPLPGVKLCITMTLPMVIEIAAASSGLAGSANLLRGVNGVVFGFFFLMGSMVWLASRERGAYEPVPTELSPSGSFLTILTCVPRSGGKL
jgi:uncharacterized membrane protein